MAPDAQVKSDGHISEDEILWEEVTREALPSVLHRWVSSRGQRFHLHRYKPGHRGHVGARYAGMREPG